MEKGNLLHFGAQRVGLDNSHESSFDQRSDGLDAAARELSDLGIPWQSTPEQKRKSLESEIRSKMRELEEFDSLHVACTSKASTKAPPKAEASGFSAQQVTELFQIFQTLQTSSSCVAADRLYEQGLIERAPRFDLKDVYTSWKAFEVYFDVNKITKDEVKFNILNGKLPWETMQQFGKEYPNSGGNFNKLESFLKAYSRQFSPCMHHLGSIAKYGDGSLLRNVLHEAKTMADLDRGERIKLNAYFLSNGPNRKILESYMHLPIENFYTKVSQKWNAPKTVPVLTTPSRPFKEYRNTAFNRYSRDVKNASPNQQGREMFAGRDSLCYYHKQWGKDAFKCKGEGCKMSGMLAEHPTTRVGQQTTGRSDKQYQGN
jgi:hypothetical protein